MHYDIPSSELTLFEKNRQISFELFFSLDEHEILSTPKNGRYLYQKDGKIKKIITQKKLGETLHQLTKKRPIRVLFDGVVKAGLYDLTKTSFQGVLLGMLIPHNQNIVTFFAKELPIEITSPSYLVVFGETNAVYIHNNQDVHNNDLKHAGYVFGDRLKIEDFPYVYH